MFGVSCYTVCKIKIAFKKTVQNSTFLMVNQVGFISIGYLIAFVKNTTNGNSSISFSCLLKIFGRTPTNPGKLLHFLAPISPFLLKSQKKKKKKRDTDVCSLVSREYTCNGSKLHQEKFRLDIWKHFFTEWVIKDWSRFPRAEVSGGQCPKLASVQESTGKCPQ